jgi:hypothetical protein
MRMLPETSSSSDWEDPKMILDEEYVHYNTLYLGKRLA